MHDPNDNFDINLSEVSKVEGAATLDIKVRNKKIEDLKFSISEWKRFYTQAIQGKPAMAVPQLVARICGTCSNAHLLCSINAVENALNIKPSEQSLILRKLLYLGLIIRDHGLHLYIFTLPDIFGKNSILDFDENIPKEKQFLEDAFAVKEVGNQLSIVVGGRSVHAPNPTVGGFLKLPKIEELKNLRKNLEQIRGKILNLIKIFADYNADLKPKTELTFSGLISDDFSFLDGSINTTDGIRIDKKELNQHLNAVVVPYSQARGFNFDGKLMMVGALARLNLNKDRLHVKTKESANEYLKIFPSKNLFHNNLAQAIEILQAIDLSTDLIDSLNNIQPEIPVKTVPAESTGVGVIEAPRGTLYHKYGIDQEGNVRIGEIIVPTGQNHVLMEKALFELVEKLLTENKSKEEIVMKSEELIRAFDPCMSCASHFLKVRWT